MKKFLLVLLIVFATATFVAADTIYLRDGRQVRGTLLGFINGQFVMRVETQLSTSPSTSTRRRDDIQYFRPEEVDRVEIDGRPMEDSRYVTRNVQVALDSNWVDSGVFVRSGQLVQVRATGVITVGRMRITPDGLRSTDPSAPLPNAADGKLIGAIGNDASSPVFELGSTREFTADRNGRLFLTANRGSFADARGSWSVEVRRERGVNFREADDLDRSGGIRSRTRGNIDRNRTREFTVEVMGNARSSDTAIDVRAGDQITFSATGTVVAGQRAGSVNPEGGRSTGFGSIIGTRPVPSAGVGALIGFIRFANGQTGQPFFIGSQLTWTAPSDGRLYLGINDDNFNDNSGSFVVRLRVTREIWNDRLE
ncbi:MAG TPA: hypothetical protein VJV21_00525 [Pyrinomonadaceae bacterium]|nr:hypothetical protein [Pyrinomonadaceae bacterium]